MRRKMRQLRPYFDVGHKVQLRPEDRLTGNYLRGLHGTITRIEQRPDPKFLGIETQEDWEGFLRIRSVHFWVKLDNFPELPDFYKHNEIVLHYRELQPLSPRMTEQQLAQYCQECFLKEQNEHRAKAYLQIMRSLKGERPDYPLSSLAYFVPEGHSVDRINMLVSWTATMRKAVQEVRERDQAHELAEIYASQAQVYDEVRERLMPKQRGFATLRGNRRSAIPARS
jgi:hypothetical protein